MNRRSRSRAAVAAIALLGVLAAFTTACGNGSVGDDDSDRGAGGGSSKPTQATSKPCPGEPLRFTTILALSGPFGNAGERTQTGLDAAVDAVNRDCTLGRPLDVKICDDKADANSSLACGRKAASDGSLAILGSIGSFDDGVAASKLPAIYGNGTSSFELTNEKSYSSISGIALGMSGTAAVKAKGAKTSTLVLPDTPTLKFAGDLIQQVAGLLKLEVHTIYFPQDTTDFAPVAAQISQADDDSIGLLPINPVVVVNALASEGITPADHTIVMPSAVITPEIMKELGDALNGMIIVSQTAPPTDTDNKGIAEFRRDLEANGVDPDDPNVDFATVTAWSNVKKLEGALLAAGPDVIKNLDSESLVKAVVDHPIDRPESAPYDFTKNALPELPSLKAFRIFTRKVEILQIEDGKYNVVSDGFIDILEPPDLN
jgi:ABC-type branched-subunit amino acid transport system substrate-binding protein